MLTSLHLPERVTSRVWRNTVAQKTGFIVAVCCMALLLHSCTALNDIFNPPPPSYKATPWFKDGTITGLTSNTEAANLDINDFLYSGMLDMYFWNTRVPKNLVPSLTNFPMPDSLLNRTITRPDDRFSFIVKDGRGYLQQLQSGAIANPLFGFATWYFSDTNLRVTRVFAGSPAHIAGLRRGMRITAIDGKPVPSSAEAYGKVIEAWGNSLSLEVEDSTKTRRTLSFMRAFFTIKSIPFTKVFSVAGKNVGYFPLVNFTGMVGDELTSAFATLRDANVQELVVDLRSNGGGFIVAAGQLSSLITGQFSGTPYVQYTHNDLYKNNNRSINMTSLPSSLRLQRVIFLVNGGSASASELTINALKPFINVVLIGTKTFGKAVGSYSILHEKSGYLLQPIAFKFTNARGEANFLDGFQPDRVLTDPVDRDFGDAQETYLRTALQYIQTGVFPAASAKGMLSNAFSTQEPRMMSEQNEIIPAIAPIEKR